MFPPSLWDATVQFSPTVELIAYIALWLIAIAGLLYVITRSRSKASGFIARWTTQDILIIAIMGVLLEVYDNLIGDQYVTPIISLIPQGHNLALNDFPYMFLLMVGVALVRKPGVATAMVFLNFLLMQLLYGGDKSSVLWWQYGIYQGILMDVYIAFRGAKLFQKANITSFWDGLVLGAVRAVPAVTISAALLGPFLNGDTSTFGDIFLNGALNLVGNGLEAAIAAPIAIRIAQSVNQSATREDAPATPAQPVLATPQGGAVTETQPAQPAQPAQPQQQEGSAQ